MEENKRKDLTRSRKALEYKVYWLERKLSFLSENKTRNTNAAIIERMPASPIKELMHLNNEFQRANEQAYTLKNLTEELNQDALRLNEQSTAVIDLGLEKIADSERLNRQSRRLHDRSRKISNEALKTMSISREINGECKAATRTAQSHIDESKYLSELTRAQHDATDVLNQETRSLYEGAQIITVESLKLNEEMDHTQLESKVTNQRARVLQNELQTVKAELSALNAESQDINSVAKTRFVELSAVEKSCNEATDHATAVADESLQQIKCSEEMIEHATILKQQTEKNILTFGRLHARAIAALTDDRKKNALQRQQLERDASITELQTTSCIREFVESQELKIRQELERHTAQSQQNADQLAMHATEYHESLTQSLQDAITESHQKTDKASAASQRQLKEKLALTENLTTELVQETRDCLGSQIEANSVLTNQIVAEFRQNSTTKLEDFQIESSTSLDDFRTESSTSRHNFEIESSTSLDDFRTESSASRHNFETESSTSLDNFETESSTSLGNFKTESSTSLDNFETESGTSLGNFKTESSTGLGNFKTESSTRLDNFETDSSTRLLDFQKTATVAVADFVTCSTSSLDKAENTADVLSHRLANTLEQCDGLFKQTNGLNEAVQKAAEESRELNHASLDLHEKCNLSITRVDGALLEITSTRKKLHEDTRKLQAQSLALNEESKKLHETSRELNDRSVSTQQENVTTQELSHQINEHSLALHEETRLINLEFDGLKKDNEDVVNRLLALKSQLTTQYTDNQEQFEDCKRTNATGEKLNQDARDLNVQSERLNQQTLEALYDANQVIVDTGELNKSSRVLSAEIRDTQNQLVQLKESVERSNKESREMTELGRQSLLESKQIQQKLITFADEVEIVKVNALTEMESLRQIGKQSRETTQKSEEAYQELQLCIHDSRQINDDFMRGLEAATDVHKETEATIQSLLDESKALQTDVRDILSLRGPLQDYQENIDQLQLRLDQYAENLNGCQQDSRLHDEQLTDYQRRIENYQAEIQHYSNAVDQFELRARRLESYFTDYDRRLKDLENVDDSAMELRITDQIETMRNLGAEIRRELTEKQHKLDIGFSDIRQSLNTAIEAQGADLLTRLDSELDRISEVTSEKISKTNHSLSQLENMVADLGQNLSADVENLRQANHDIQGQSRELQLQSRNHLREYDAKINHVDDKLDVVKQQLDNYQQLLQGQIDSDQSAELSNRINLLESSIKNQQRMLDRNETFQADIKALVEDHTNMDELTEMVSEYSRSLEEAGNTNQSLKAAISESATMNGQLLKSNKQLHASLQEREPLMHEYADRISRLEKREREYKQTITSLKTQESDTDHTLQQMRVAMKDSTRAMRETQKTLEKFRTEEKTSNPNWVENSKQAALTSTIAVIFAGLAMFGYERVDAAIEANATYYSQPGQELFALQIPTHNRLVKSGDKTLIPLQRANDSIALHGEFAWPVNFGIVDPTAIRYQAHRRGISISAELGDPVVAVNDGTVIYSADEIRGYGNVIVIQHDENLVSIYANNQFNYVKEGDKVLRGQLIGDIGQLFNKNEAGLYFEIRYMGTPEDPFHYLGQTLQPGFLDSINRG